MDRPPINGTLPKWDFLFDGISTNFKCLAIGKSIIIEINVINDESRKIKIKLKLE